MSAGPVRFVERIRKPEYTGVNRCIPCTVVNVVLAVAFAAVAAAGLDTTAGARAGTIGGGIVIGLSLLVIYARGYLVPGTPTLTKRYFPDWVLSWFDKDPRVERDSAGESHANEKGVNAERILVDGGVTVPCADGDDLCLADGVREHWRELVVSVREGDRQAQLAAFVERDAEAVHVDDPEDDDRIVVVADGETVAAWESEAALIADLAGSQLLSDHIDSWHDRPLHERGQVLGGLRAFLETCPACDGRISIDEETVESCCRSFEVYAVTCDDCETRLLEVSA